MVGFMNKFSIFNVFNVRLCSWGQMNNIQLFLSQKYLLIIGIFGLLCYRVSRDSTYLKHSKKNSLWNVNMMISTFLIEISVSKGC